MFEFQCMFFCSKQIKPVTVTSFVFMCNAAEINRSIMEGKACYSDAPQSVKAGVSLQKPSSLRNYL